MRKIYTIILIAFFILLLSSRGFVLPYGGHSSLLFSISHVLADDGGDGGGDGGDGDSDEGGDGGGDGGDGDSDDGGGCDVGGSSATTSSCNNPTQSDSDVVSLPSVEIAWDLTGFLNPTVDQVHLYIDKAIAGINPIVFTQGGFSTVGSYTWTGGAINTAYNYWICKDDEFCVPAQIETDGNLYTSGSFTTQNCSPPSLQDYTLTVNSLGASAVSITSSSGHGGITNYSKSNLVSGTNVSLTAPTNVGALNFSSWAGCDFTADNNCTVSMTADKTVVVNYVTLPPPPPPPSVPTCPLTPKDGRTIVNLGSGSIISSGSLSAATKGPISVSISAVTYDIRLVSYDPHLAKLTQVQPNERWFLVLKDNLGLTIATTSAISDLESDEEYKEEKVETNLVLASSTASITAIHAAFSDTNPNSIMPLCVAFDEVVVSPPPPPPPPPPVCPLPTIISELSATITVSQSFSYTLTATTTGVVSTTTSFTVATSGLPNGLSYSTSTNTILGTSTETGTFNIAISATNDCGTDEKTLVIIVNSNGGGEDDDGDGGGGGGGGGGSSSGSGGGGSSRPSTSTSTVTEAVCFYLRDYMRRDFANDPIEVLKLQGFLRNFEGHSEVTLTGVFDQATFDAVSAFQMKYFSDILEPWGHTGPTGYVYILTLKKINEIYCQRIFPLNQSQVNEIAAFRALLDSLRTRGVDVELPPPSESGSVEERGLSTTTPIVIPIVGEAEPPQGQNLRNLAAAIFALPDNLLDIIKCSYEFLLVIIVLYILGNVLKDVLYKNIPENAKK